MPAYNPTNIAELNCGQIGKGLLTLLRKLRGMQLVAVAFLIIWVIYSEPQYLLAIIKITIGSVAILLAWQNERTPGLPIILIVSLQSFMVYAMPLISGNELLAEASSEAISDAATEVMLYGFALAAGWKIGLVRKVPRKIQIWAFTFLGGHGSESRLALLSLYLLGGTLAFVLGIKTTPVVEILNSLPNGAGSILQTLSEATAMGGGLVGGFVLGSGKMNSPQKSTYWILISLLYIILISDFLLSNATGLICAVTLGLIMGKQKLPVLFIVIVGSVSFFFNFTKFDMRAKYWDRDQDQTRAELADLPNRMFEWFELSSIAIFESESRDQIDDNQRLANRVNNLSILLFAQNAVKVNAIPPLQGATYRLIPELLIPRILWPEKPRAHAGQELLNVYFERQTLKETQGTFIAWGLLAEAYGNFGPWAGAIIFGVPFGFLLGRLESWSRPYPLKCLQTFLVLAFMVQVGTAFEMVASVFVTSTFQQLVAISAASFLLVHRTTFIVSPGQLNPGNSTGKTN